METVERGVRRQETKEGQEEGDSGQEKETSWER